MRKYFSHRMPLAECYMVFQLVYSSICTYPSVLPILLGIIVTLFFQCVGALIGSGNDTRRSVKLGLVAYTAALFSFSTISLVVGRDEVSVGFVDTRNFPGTEAVPPGPIGGTDIFRLSSVCETLIGFPTFVNQWLSDGLLVSFISNSAICARYTYSSSYIVAMSFMA